MKKLLFAIFLLLPFVVKAQLSDIDNKTASQLSAITDDETESDADYWNTHAYLYIQNLVKALTNRAYNDNDFGSISAAITAANDSSKRLIVSSTHTTSGDITLGSNVDFTYGAIITIVSGDTVTLGTGFDADRVQIFTGSGAVRATSGGTIKPEWFGVTVGTEGATAMQKAFDALTHDCVLSFGAGQYLLGTALDIADIDSSVTFMGIPGATVLKRPDDNNTDAILNFGTAADNIVIAGITFNVNQANQTGASIRQKAISIGSADNITIENCVFIGGDSLHSSNEMVNISNVTNFSFRNNKVLANRNLGLILDNVDGGVVSSNIFTGDGADIITGTGNAISIRDGSSKIIVSGNYIDLIDGSGVYIDDPDQSGAAPTQIVVTGNIISRTYGDCILAEQGYYIVVANNIIEGDHPTAGGDTGISLGGAFVSAIGNIIRGKTAVGISLFNNSKAQQSAYYKMAIGNVIEDVGNDDAGASYAGIWLDDAIGAIVGLNSISDTNVSGGTGDDSTNAGIHQSGTSAKNILVANGIGKTQDNIDYNSGDYVIGNVDFDSLTAEYRNIVQQSDITPNEYGGHKQSIVYHYDNVAAGLTNQVVPLDTSSGTLAYWQAPRAGSILSITVRSIGSRSAGDFTVNVRDEGESAGAGLSATIDASNTFSATSTQSKDTQAFTAGQRIYVELNSDGSWAPTTADITITVEVEY